MKKIVIMCLLMSSVICYSQVYKELKAGLNHVNDKSDDNSTRRLGAEVGCHIGKTFIKHWSWETGFVADFYGRRKNEFVNSYTGENEEISYFKVSGHVPILLVYTSSSGSFQLLTGVGVEFNNILSISKYSGDDPERPLSNDDGKLSASTTIDLGCNFSLSKRTKLYGAFRLPSSSFGYSYGILSLGVLQKF